MYGYVLDVFIWSFAIYGFVNFCKDFLLEWLLYIVLKFIYIVKLSVKFIVKKIRKMYNWQYKRVLMYAFLDKMKERKVEDGVKRSDWRNNFFKWT